MDQDERWKKLLSQTLLLDPRNTPIRQAVALIGSVHFTAEALGVTYDELQDLIYDRAWASDVVRDAAGALVAKTLAGRRS